jgi:hypothetical protein
MKDFLLTAYKIIEKDVYITYELIDDRTENFIDSSCHLLIVEQCTPYGVNILLHYNYIWTGGTSTTYLQVGTTLAYLLWSLYDQTIYFIAAHTNGEVYNCPRKNSGSELGICETTEYTDQSGIPKKTRDKTCIWWMLREQSSAEIMGRIFFQKAERKTCS